MSTLRPLDPSDPQELGSYRLRGRLGQGGQGVVYLADSASGEGVAVKLFHLPLEDDQAGREAFARELEIAKRVARFCTAQVLDVGNLGARPYIVSEYVPGPSLQHVVRDEGPRAGSALDRLAISTATALVALHDAGIVHRDFKPHNVLLGPDGPRVIDFGIARALAGAGGTLSSQTVGTPSYMAPEQVHGTEIGPPVDIFAWGSTLAFAATGRPPFGRDSIPAVMHRIINGEPDLDGIEAPLLAVLTTCLAKNPADRPTAQQLLDQLVRRGAVAPEASGTSAIASAWKYPPWPTTDEAGSAGVPHPADQAGGPGPPPHAIPAADQAGSADVPSRATPMAGQTGGASLPPYAIPAADTRRDGEQTEQTRPNRGRRVAMASGVVALAVLVGGGAALALTGPPDWLRPAGAASPRPAAVDTTASPAPRPPPGAESPAPIKSSPRASRTSTATSAAKPSPKLKPKPKSSAPSAPSPRPSPKPQRVELGPGHFTGWCKQLGYEWVERRETPQPGAYCIKRKSDPMFLTKSQRDAGCQWRYNDKRALHYWNGKSNYCYRLS